MSDQSDEFGSTDEFYNSTEVTDLKSFGLDFVSESEDDETSEEWIQIADFVESTAAEIVNEILDVEALEESAHGLDFDSATLNELRDAMGSGGPVPPPAPTGPAPSASLKVDTREIELDEASDADPDDVFESTGIEIIDIDTGELIESSPKVNAAFEQADPAGTEGVSTSAERMLAIRLGHGSDAIELRGFWGRYLAELKAEISAEQDPRHRAAYVFVFVSVVRALTGRDADAIADFLEGVSDDSGATLRSTLLEGLAAQWNDPGPRFFRLMERLETLDAGQQGAVATIQRSAIAMERLLEGGIDDSAREELRKRMIPPETFGALVVKAVEGHVSGKISNSIAAWSRLAKHAHGELRRAAASVVVHYLRGSASFFSITGKLLEELKAPRGFLTMIQREAVDTGNRFEEARAIKRLIAQDVRAGRKLRGAAEEEQRRLRRETAGRLFRLSTLLTGLQNVDFTQTDLEGMTGYEVLRDAVSMHASNLVLLRRLERWARDRGDLGVVAQALASQASLVDDPKVQALIWERLAAYHEGEDASVQTMLEYLDRALTDDPECLPALISRGQYLIAYDELDDMIELRGSPEGVERRTVDASWRRAELLERTEGDPREILSFYREAREEDPDSVHLFFCVERALARLGDWRGLRTLYDASSAEGSGLGAELARAGLELDTMRLVVETFLEEAPGALHDDWRSYLEHRDGRDAALDEPIEWRVADDSVRSADVNAVARRVEGLVFETREDGSLQRARLRVWSAYLADFHLDDRGGAIEAYRELYAGARGIFQRRFALQGLLRNQDFAWIANAMLHEEDGLWGWASPELTQPVENYLVRIAAELFALGSEHDRAIDLLADVAVQTEDSLERATVAERAVHHAMRSQRWARAFQFLPECFANEDPRTLAEFSRHLAAALDDPEDALRGLEEAGGFTSSSPIVLLDELELAYRASDFQRVTHLLNRSLATAEAGSIGFRAFVLEQAILNATWGYESPELTLSCVDDLWSLDAAMTGGSPFFAVAAFIRTFSWLGRQDELDEWIAYARSNFTPEVAQGLVDEATLMQNVPGGEAAARWYSDRIETVAAPLKPYTRWMAATLRWVFGQRDEDSAAELAAACTEDDPTHRVGAFLVTLAYRHEKDHDSAARQFRLLRRAGHSRPVQSWALIRSLFHLGVTQKQPEKAIELVENEDAYLTVSWISIATELFGRSLRRTVAVERIQNRARSADGARALRLELAQILGDLGMFPRLAQQGEPGAQVLTELLAAQGERPHAPGWSIEHRYRDLQESIASETQEQVRRRLMAFLLEVDEVFWGSPWCPLRLTHCDLTRFGLSLEELEALRDRVSNFEGLGAGSEARLLVAREFQRMGRRDVAIDLMPKSMQDDAISLAWAMLGIALDPFGSHPKTSAWMLDLWGVRRSLVPDLAACRIGAEIAHEVGRALEGVGRVDEAVDAYEDAIAAKPTFLPGQVAVGRILIRTGNWKRLAHSLELQLQGADDPELQASMAFRLGYLYNRRLGDEVEADVRAEDFYLRVLRHKPNHLPSLEALLDLAYRQHNYDAAAQYLARMAQLTDGEEVAVAYRVELATLYEHQLDDRNTAAEIFESVLEQKPWDVLAFQGLVRCDLHGGAATRHVARRFETGIAPREIDDMGHVLFALSGKSDEARALLERAVEDYLPALIVRLCDVVQSGMDDAALATLERAYLDSESRFLAYVFERVGRPRPLVGTELIQACQLGNDPVSEGRLVRAMHHAWKEEDLEALGLLATSRARRARSPIVRSAELTWMVATQYMRGEPQGALEVCERLLTQYMDFLPAVKLAKVLSLELESWESTVRWHKRDAHLSKVDAIAQNNRLLASSIQRDQLGDIDSAVDELEKVIAANPRHPDAFGRLKDLLHVRRDFRQLLEAYENQIRHSRDDDECSAWLNEMTDIALQQLEDRPRAIHFLTRSLKRVPRQRARLKMLAELYEAEERFEQAVSCYRASANLTEDSARLHRLWSHIGELQEGRLDRLDDAKSSYLKALAIQPEDSSLLVALSRVCEARMELHEALEYLRKALKVSRDSNVLKHVRISIVRVEARAGEALDGLLQSTREVLLHHPEHLEAVDDVRSRLAGAGRESELSEYLREITVESLRRFPERPVASQFELARRVGLNDRAFCIASLVYHHGDPTSTMKDFYEANASPRRWPRRAIPVDQTASLVPGDLVAPVLEVMRITQTGLADSLEYVPGSEHIRRSNRQREATGTALGLAFKWPQLYGLELRDVHVADEEFGDGSEVVYDGGIRLVLDKRWKDSSDPTELLVGLGRKLAAWSMGVGLWGRFDAEAGMALFIWVVSRFVSGWSVGDRELPEILATPRFARWLSRKGTRVPPYALEISGRFGTAAVEKQFYTLHQAFERFALVCIDDPGLGLKYSRLRGSAEVGEMPWLFLFDPAPERIRSVLGIAIQ